MTKLENKIKTISLDLMMNLKKFITLTKNQRRKIVNIKNTKLKNIIHGELGVND